MQLEECSGGIYAVLAPGTDIVDLGWQKKSGYKSTAIRCLAFQQVQDCNKASNSVASQSLCIKLQGFRPQHLLNSIDDLSAGSSHSELFFSYCRWNPALMMSCSGGGGGRKRE